MLMPAQPFDEEQRVAALHALRLLDTHREEPYDSITQAACDEFSVTISAITLIDTERQWFKSVIGMADRETSRAISFCAYTILKHDCFVVEDASTDERFHDHPFVKREPNIRFYAGCSIRTPSGYRIGALCIAHNEARGFDLTDHAKLTELSRITEEQIALDYPK